jgi:hypothetical protein
LELLKGKRPAHSAGGTRFQSDGLAEAEGQYGLDL